MTEYNPYKIRELKIQIKQKLREIEMLKNRIKSLEEFKRIE